jgi:hypothetical protein
MEMNLVAGTFSIPSTDDSLVKGTGMIDGSYYRLSTDPGASATGILNAGLGVWSMDYAEGTAPTTVTVHLEGSLQGTSIP